MYIELPLIRLPEINFLCTNLCHYNTTFASVQLTVVSLVH